MSKIFKQIGVFVLFLFLPFFSCEDAVDTNVPYSYVYEVINLNEYPFNLLNVDGNSVDLSMANPNYKPAYNGIIIFRETYDQYYAFDRCCTHNFSERHTLIPDGIFARCPVDSSEFIMLGGQGVPVRGPAKLPLRRYKTLLNGNIITISNYN